MRTFKKRPIHSDTSDLTHSKVINVPAGAIAIYDRCLECLTSGITYVTISHVWDPEVSAAQDSGPTAAVAASAQKASYSFPLNVYQGIEDSLGKAVEIWHDYISVPQWNEELKKPILMAIPELFSHASFTLVHLHDVSHRSVLHLRGATPLDRIRGLTDICNAMWFRRIWTAMEYVRSERVNVMFDDYRVFNGTSDLFLGEMEEVWSDEIRRQGNVHEVEELVGTSNLVPWRLGPLHDIRILKQTSFGHAFSLLSRRICTKKHDFFYALLGIVKADMDQVDGNDREACRQIAAKCMEADDYSPILMLPRCETQGHSHYHHGYHDVRPWGLGKQTCAPSIAHGISINSDTISLKAERIGSIHSAEGFQPMDFNEMEMFAHLARTVCRQTEPNLSEFVSTLGTRMCGQDTDEILERSEMSGGILLVESVYSDLLAPPKVFDWSAGDNSSINWLAEASGLSNHSLRKAPKMKGETPLHFLRARGGSIHGGATGAILEIHCHRCHKGSLYRAALLKHPSKVQMATAYRIPGLSYEYTLSDGIGIIVQDGKIIGRMIWARPACECREIEEVELEYPQWEMPDPNTLDYGIRGRSE
ncbi:hypothetical protein SLS56_008686 [Neofusicoccum ribis]|uniref:Heterokaryon incompatibility domain-containing protein n=1 Tax=Neofusicoccum ribis TaxID=45134 RepID=A0ABR3SJB8_9PEZI